MASLRDHLYKHFYCTAAALPSSDSESRALSAAPSAMFVQRLSEANCGNGYLEPGWEVCRITPTLLGVSRYGLELQVPRAACQVPPGLEVSTGLTIAIRMPKELVDHMGSCYFAMSDHWMSEREWLNVVRVYWNVTPEGAIELIHQATAQLNAAGLPFHLKVFRDLGRSGRADGAVLYLQKRNYEAARRILQSIVPRLAPQLRSTVPAFTKSLAPGVGLAEDPGNGLSFGEHRCGLIAEALIDANDLGKRSAADRVDIVLEHFTREGVSLEKPYLNPGSDAAYDFEVNGGDMVGAHAVAGGVGSSRARVSPQPDGSRYVHTARGIGHQICADAKWSGSRCNWMGSTVDVHGRACAVALDPCLYAGTSGVALFLAELHVATGDPILRTTSIAAIEQALTRADTVGAADRLSLFSGWIGIALAAVRIGIVLQRDDLLARAQNLLARLEWEEAGVKLLDHLSGAAGAIVGLLALRNSLEDSSLEDTAVRLGEVILDRAMKTKAHWSWRTINTRRQMNLTGLSHGVAGIASALLELYRCFGDARYLRAAEAAFAYERHWFADDLSNWPDLRGYPLRSVRKGDVLPCAAMWCHGAAGIALSRLRACEIAENQQWAHEALLALQATRKATERALRMNTMNFSLCHGLAGNADVLQLGAAALGPAFEIGASLAADIAETGMARHAVGGEAWPSGDAGPTPAFMTGLAGIGYWYLRLSNPAIPSLLLLNPERCGAKAAPESSLAVENYAAFPA